MQIRTIDMSNRFGGTNLPLCTAIRRRRKSGIDINQTSSVGLILGKFLKYTNSGVARLHDLTGTRDDGMAVPKRWRSNIINKFAQTKLCSEIS